MTRLLMACLTLLLLSSTAGAEPAAQSLLWVEALVEEESQHFFVYYDGFRYKGAGTLVDPSGLMVISLDMEPSAYSLQRFVVTSPVTEKRYEADIVAVDTNLKLGFLRIVDWEEDLPAAQFDGRALPVGEQVYVLDRLTPENGFAVTKAFATVGGQVGQLRPQALLDRALKDYRGLPVLDAEGKVVGLVGSDCGKMTRVVSPAELEHALLRLESLNAEAAER